MVTIIVRTESREIVCMTQVDRYWLTPFALFVEIGEKSYDINLGEKYQVHIEYEDSSARILLKEGNKLV